MKKVCGCVVCEPDDYGFGACRRCGGISPVTCEKCGRLPCECELFAEFEKIHEEMKRRRAAGELVLVPVEGTDLFRLAPAPK